jgi:hypothetical protein
MAHFAKIDNNNIVTNVIVINDSDCIDTNNNESEEVGSQFCSDLLGGNWIQTSYNNKIRKNFAGIGMTYDSSHDAFIPIQTYPSWVLNYSTFQWEAPTPKPSSDGLLAGEFIAWDEDNLSWIVVGG